MFGGISMLRKHLYMLAPFLLLALAFGWWLAVVDF
ncbi:hypothetical protein HNR40_003433 [Nonomuraea endophytica]|uniref:Uncharacterized protein n=1 Tax=Nonomuraea endophytica TaxID=714136 RepID=A0A7W8A435_9ACTN|nr:hypothetical protein [Nonomuraea endophytica]